MILGINQIYNNLISSFSTKELPPSVWMEANRVIQKHVSEKLHGKFDMGNTPYMRQITDHLSPYDPTQEIVLMKGVRIGGTFCLVHNGVPYIMANRPTNIMLLSANKDLATKTMQGVDSGIDGCNIRYLLGKGSGVQSNSKGDTMEKKFFSGGFELFNFGGQSATNMRQVTAGLVVADELDAFKATSKEAGEFLKVMKDRTRSYGESKKIIYLSSPLLYNGSLIFELYQRGNQNVYYVPCPCCGEMIELIWNGRNENNTRYGVIFDVRDGEVVKKSVRYRCGKCENEFFEIPKLKKDILNAGEWIPQTEREDKTFVSYRLSALYAPPSMDNWYDFAKEYQMAYPRGGTKNEAKFQSFRNSIEGLPYKPEGIKLKSSKLQQNRRDYQIGECPFELSVKDGNGQIVMVTLSCDLNGYENDARLDWEIEAHTVKGATYSIDAGSCGTFIPKVERIALGKEGKDITRIEADRQRFTYRFDVANSVWKEFEEIVNRRFGNSQIPITLTCVDVGHLQDHALEFIRRVKKKGKLIIGVKGANSEQFQENKRTDKGRIYEISSNGLFYLVNVNIIKDDLARYMNANSYIDDNGQLHQDANFMNFPAYNPKLNKYTYRNYFAHFEAETRREKTTADGKSKFIWEKKDETGIQNHFWDVCVYNKFARIFMTDFFCSNDYIYKTKKYGTAKIPANWDNASRLLLEFAKDNNIILG